MLIDQHNRKINYLRLSVTDRCDFRCQYCMGDDIEFMPKNKMLTIEEIHRLAKIFISLGVEKIRITGGEPLVRRGIDDLFASLGNETELKELTLTTNGSQLNRKFKAIKNAGVKRINVSLDSLNADNFYKMTKGGNLNQILANLQEIKNEIQVKLNVVIMKGSNDHEIMELVNYAIDNSFNISFIEEMPLGDIGYDRSKTSISSDEIKNQISTKLSLKKIQLNTGGPAKYWLIENTKTTVGFISPHSHNFCESCNRLRLSADGFLHLCLGHDDGIDLITPLRKAKSDDLIRKIILNALTNKPKSHEFNLRENTEVVRFMSHTGG